MSATLPNLDLLTDNNEMSVNLIQDKEKYFKNHKFKNRVIPDYSLLKSKGKITLEELKDHVLKNASGKKVLIEFIKRKSAEEFYDLISQSTDVPVLLMTGGSSIQERKNIISKLEHMNNVILVATQVVEAGVDIDMDIGYKDISRLDSEEQFMGRINRSCNKENCIVYFFNIDEASNIYIQDARVDKNCTLENDNIKKILEEKDFSKYYSDEIFPSLMNMYNSYGDKNMSDFFRKNTAHLNMPNIAKRMKLIDDERLKIYLYLNRKIQGVEYNAEELWKEYKAILLNPKLINNRYPEKKVRLQEVRSKMNAFIYQVQADIDWVKHGDYEQIGDIYYIKNGDNYVDENGMIDRKKVGDNEEVAL